VEVGFSQSYEDLVLDARQWLLRSTRPPNVVILVKIEEGIASLRSHKCTIAYQSRLKTLLLQHCDAYALASADLDGTGAPEINVDVLREQIVIEDWVGNLRVFIEVWVRSSAESDNICSRGARCVSLVFLWFFSRALLGFPQSRPPTSLSRPVHCFRLANSFSTSYQCPKHRLTPSSTSPI
jgi:hypothetical protein